MSARVAGAYLEEMIRVLEPQWGQQEAIRRVANRVGLSFWPVAKLAKGKVKTINTENYVRIHAAYLDWQLDDLKALIERKEERLDAAQGQDLGQSLAKEIAALKARVRQMEKVQT